MIKEVKGWHVLAVILAFFGITFLVNAIFVTYAVGTFPGEDAPKSYLQGLAYNEVLERRARQRELGWRASVEMQNGGRLEIVVQDAQGAALSGLALAGEMRHGTDAGLDAVLTVAEVGGGVYAAEAGDLPPGRWTARLWTQEGEPFEVERQFWLR